MNFDKMQKRLCAVRIRQESVRGGLLGLSDSTVGECVTITTEMSIYDFRCVLNMTFGRGNCSWSRRRYSLMMF